jgi:hypothetical protein
LAREKYELSDNKTDRRYCCRQMVPLWIGEWYFLDSRIFSPNGYSWGTHSWTVVQGAQARRVVCLVCGIQQPQRIKGESLRRPLAILRQEIPVNPKDGCEGLGF